MQIDQLKEILKEFGENVKFDHDLKKKIGLISAVNQKFSIKQIT